MTPLSTQPSAEELLRLAATELPLVFWQVDHELNFTASFGAGLAHLNLQPGEVLGRSLFGFLQTTDPEFPLLKLHRDALQGQAGCQDARWAGRDYQVRVAPVRSAAGEIVGCVGVAEDVTERTLAAEELLRSQARWQSLVESAPNIVMNLELDGTITFINRAEAPDTPQQVTGTNYFDYVHPDYVDTVRDCLETVARTGQAAGYEVKGPATLPDTWWIARIGPVVRGGAVVAFTIILTEITNLKCSEQALRESHEKYRLLVDNQTDLIAEFTADRRLVYASPSCCRTMGMTEEELLKSDFLSFIHEADRQRVLDSVNTVFRPPYVSHVEDRMWTKIGWRWYAWINSAVRNDAGEVVAVVGIGRDITERKESEAVLRASEARFRAVFDRAATGIALASLDGRLIQANSALRNMLGYAEDEVPGLELRAFTFPEDVEAEIRGIGEVRAGRSDVYRAEKRYRRKDGTTMWGDLSCTFVRDPQGEPLFAVGMVEDITVRKQVEAELGAVQEDLRQARDKAELRVKERTASLAAANARLAAEIAERSRAETALGESERRFRLAFEESPWGMTIIGPDGTWLQVNQAFCRMLGYDAAELVGMYAAEVTHPDDLQCNSELTRQLVEGEIRSFHFEKRYIRKDGGLVWAEVSATVVRDENGGILYGLTMVEDVTQRKQAQLALRRAERLSSIGTLAAGIAHEVNNPLGAIQLDAETALYCLDQPRQQKTVADCLRNIAASSRRAAQIVKDVLRFARTGVRPKAIDDLRRPVERACRLMRRLAEESGVRIEFAPPQQELPVRLNTTEIEQVLVNLIANAVQASPPGERVEINLDRESETACVSVRDFSRGMPPEEADRVFDPFFTTRETEGGTGLGLSISYGIVREHEGTIEVDTLPGRGTTMVVRLPLDSSQGDGTGEVPRGGDGARDREPTLTDAGGNP